MSGQARGCEPPWALLGEGNTAAAVRTGLCAGEPVSTIGGMDTTEVRRCKYPRTAHVAWSPGRSDDDIGLRAGELLTSCDDVVVTLKLDGENTTVYPDGTCHARSLDSAAHPSRTRVRALAAQLGPQLPAGWRVCGENLQARHSIGYRGLTGVLYVFSVWDDTNTSLSWDDTARWCNRLGVPHVPAIYRGPFDRAAIEAAFDPYRDRHEGWVARTADPIGYTDFGAKVAKWVRAGHVTSGEHWMHSELVWNEFGGANPIPDAGD